MNRIFPKSKLVFVNLVFLLVILTGILLVESGPEPWLDREMAFMDRLQNSLVDLDRAKDQWAIEKNKPEDAVPTFDDLAPYLGDAKKTIKQLQALGIEYKITSTEINQSDVATLTQGIRFRTGFCCYCRAGTTVSLHSGWASPPTSVSPLTLRIQLILLHAEVFFEAALFILVLANAIIFFVRKLTQSSKRSESRDAPFGT